MFSSKELKNLCFINVGFFLIKCEKNLKVYICKFILFMDLEIFLIIYIRLGGNIRIYLI